MKARQGLRKVVFLIQTPSPQTTPIFTFCVAFHIFIVGKHTEFKFGMQLDCSKSQVTDDKLPLKGAWWRYVTFVTFKIFSLPKISLERLKLETSNFVHWLAVWTISLWIYKQSHKWPWSRSRVLFKFWKIIYNISEMVQDRDIVTMED